MKQQSARHELLQRIAQRLVEGGPDRLMVAVDGVDGAGKSFFADGLADVVSRLGRPAVRASVDGFHNPRAVRYRRGKDSPEGFFLDSFNYIALRDFLLVPFQSGAEQVQTARFDHRTDSEVRGSAVIVPPASVLLLDGIFLHREELVAWWDASIFLDVPFDVSYARMATRDGSDPNPEAPRNRRYLEGQRIYLRRCKPRERATIVIDNADFAIPMPVKW